MLFESFLERGINQILITTDLRGDNIVALYLLIKHLKIAQDNGLSFENLKFNFIVGEGTNIELKKQRLQILLDKWRFRKTFNIDYHIWDGFGSDKEYLDEGTSTFTKEEITQFSRKPTTKYNQYVPSEHSLYRLAHYLTEEEDNLLIISLKPMTELIWLFENGAFENCEAIYFMGYMSFNVRQLFKYTNLYRDAITNFLSFVNEVYLYETYIAIGSNNNVTSLDINFNIFPEEVLNEIYLWNYHCYHDCLRSLSKYFSEYQNISEENIDALELSDDLKDNLKRDLKVVNSIKGYMLSQFVNADPAIIYWLFTEDDLMTWEFNVRGYVTFTPKGYTKLKFDPRYTSKPMMLTSEDDEERKELRDLQIKFYKDSL